LLVALWSEPDPSWSSRLSVRSAPPTIEEVRVSPFGFLVPSFPLQLYFDSSVVSLPPLVHGFPCPNDAIRASRTPFLVVRVLSSTLLPGFSGPESSLLPVDLPPSAPPLRVLLVGIGFLTSVAAFNVSSGGLPWVRRTTSPYPVQLHFGSPDIRSRSPMPARPPPRCHIVGSLFATYMGSASCFLRTPHFWNLPLPCWRCPSFG